MKMNIKTAWTCHRMHLNIDRHLLRKFVGNIFNIRDAPAEEQPRIPVDNAYCVVTTTAARICGPTQKNRKNMNEAVRRMTLLVQTESVVIVDSKQS
jgi:hypothetical protein